MSGSPVKATQRQLKALTRNQTRARHNAEIPEIEGAGKVIESLQKQLKKLEGEVALMRNAYEDVFRWCTEKGMRPGRRRGGASDYMR